jgi:ABC-type phosphate/phosphonate transport system substrate-binding protein
MKALTSLLVLMFISPLLHADIRLGINAPRGELVSLKNWMAMSEYLSAALGERVRILPLASSRFLAYSDSEIDKPLHFALANPVQTLSLRDKNSYVPLLSVQTQQGERYGGVIIARVGHGIENLQDLRGKKVIGMPPSSAGAHVFPVYHLSQHGIDAYKDLALFSYARNQDLALLALYQGNFDAAFIRTGVIEAMTGIDQNQFVVLDAQHDSDFPYAHSTALYPEYVLSAAPATPVALQEKFIALLQQAPNASLRSAGISGFNAPVSLQEVEKVVAELNGRLLSHTASKQVNAAD